MAQQIKNICELGVQTGIVVGGGNILRGWEAESEGMDRSTADYAGMLATIINALALQDALERHHDLEVRTQSAITVQQIAEPYIRRRAIRHLEKGRVVIFAGGTGNPFMTTDTAAALRAIEIEAKVLLMAKNNVDGVYEADPNLVPNAAKIDFITHQEALERRLRVMDATARSLCMDNDLPIIVFDLFETGSIEEIIAGDPLGGGLHKVTDLVEKPAPEEAPSDLAIIGRYLLTPDVYPALERTERGRGGEIQLTDGLRRLLAQRPIFAVELDGVRHDAGNKPGYLRAILHFARKHPELRGVLAEAAGREPAR